MVGYDPKKKLTELDYIIAGSAAGFVTRLFCQPFDVLKIRFQLQVEPIHKKSTLGPKYHSLFQATRLIIKEEGASALWKGHVPGQFLSISYGLSQFTIFEILTEKAAGFERKHNLNYAINFACGLISGCTATLISFPFDVIRTRLVAQNDSQRVYRGVIHALHLIIKQEGPIVLFRGVIPTFLQVGPHAGAHFMFYKIFDGIFKDLLKSKNITITSSVISGSLAGFCAKIVVFPLDIVKKRIQVQGFDRGLAFGKKFECNGMIDCFYKIYKNEGIFAFFKGLNAGMLKAVVTSAMFFSSYEMVCETLQNYRNVS